ncbi:Ig-like domain-containing protein [Ekhidna sp.]|uniref:Ig-like domain-containing protein n=1 Tax=Ekhidna sp. TaxID=2608089 RepID=UPI003519B4BF
MARSIKNYFLLLAMLMLACNNDQDSEPGIQAIELNKTLINLEVTDRDSVKVTTDIGDLDITWESSNPDVATIDEDGDILALNSGSTTITANVDGITATCEVNVEVTIFVGGSAMEFEAVYWKNGKINYLTTTGNDEGYYSWVNSIRVLNGDVFSGGLKLEQNTLLWKNSEEIILGNGYNEVKEIAIKGNDVYAAVGNGKVFRWNESEELELLSDDASRAHSIFIKNEDIYVGGLKKISEEFRPAIWKNGSELILNNDEYTWVTDVFVDGDDFYVCGYEYIGGGLSHARYWKNTVKTNLTDGSTKAIPQSIAVKDGDIYIGGSLNNRPAIWKNEEATFYAESGIDGSINEIQFHDGNLYAAGEISLESSSYGVVWKNGEEIFRTDVFDQGTINCISVK